MYTKEIKKVILGYCSDMTNPDCKHEPIGFFTSQLGMVVYVALKEVTLSKLASLVLTQTTKNCTNLDEVLLMFSGQSSLHIIEVEYTK